MTPRDWTEQNLTPDYDFQELYERSEDAKADKADDEYNEREPKEDNE